VDVMIRDSRQNHLALGVNNPIRDRHIFLTKKIKKKQKPRSGLVFFRRSLTSASWSKATTRPPTMQIAFAVGLSSPSPISV
jgi:hypothetical protein